MAYQQFNLRYQLLPKTKLIERKQVVMDYNFLLFACFAFLSYFTGTFAGFGGVIIVLALGAHLYPIRWMLPVLQPLLLIINFYILIRHHQHINKTVLMKRILPFMSIGLVIGFMLFNLLHGVLFRRLFGLMVMLVAGRELFNLLRNSQQNQKPLPAGVSMLYVFFAGLIHGIYVSGGPLLVYAANKMQLEKSVFRATLIMVWLIMNIFLSVSYVLADKINLESLRYSALLLPSLILGLLLGDLLHQRIPERGFKIAVFALLIVSGFFITLK